VPAAKTIDAMRLLAKCEGIVADPVYEGKSLVGLIELIEDGVLRRGSRVLFLHMGGTPAIHGYAELLREAPLSDFPSHSRALANTPSAMPESR
jgi:1-aminocyclopropane-1-carboxylate deaminase/D-cysteine desulfhydrase-like pyridoxal-dependent ACC family enzyme